MLRYAYAYRQFLYGLYGSVGGFFARHAVLVNVHCLCYGNELVERSGSVVFHYYRQQQRVSHTVRYVEYCSERVSHSVNYAEANVRERHAGYVLRHRHAVACVGIGRFVYGCFEVAVYHFDSLYLEHVAHFPSAFGGKAFYCVG